MEQLKQNEQQDVTAESLGINIADINPDDPAYAGLAEVGNSETKDVGDTTDVRDNGLSDRVILDRNSIANMLANMLKDSINKEDTTTNAIDIGKNMYDVSRLLALVNEKINKTSLWPIFGTKAFAEWFKDLYLNVKNNNLNDSQKAEVDAYTTKYGIDLAKTPLSAIQIAEISTYRAKEKRIENTTNELFKSYEKTPRIEGEEVLSKEDIKNNVINIFNTKLEENGKKDINRTDIVVNTISDLNRDSGRVDENVFKKNPDATENSDSSPVTTSTK